MQVICNHTDACIKATCPHHGPHDEKKEFYDVCTDEAWCRVAEKNVICIPEDELPIIETEEDWRK